MKERHEKKYQEKKESEIWRRRKWVTSSYKKNRKKHARVERRKLSQSPVELKHKRTDRPAANSLKKEKKKKKTKKNMENFEEEFPLKKKKKA